MALLGWNPGTDKEIFTLEELVKLFDISKIQKGGAVFDEDKLKWIHGEHMKRLSEDERFAYFKKTFNKVPAWAKAYEEKPDLVKTLFEASGIQNSPTSDQIELLKSGYLDFGIQKQKYAKELLLWKDTKDLSEILRHIQWAIETLAEIPNANWTNEAIKEAVWEYATQMGRGNVLWPMRMALSGQEKSPDPFTIAFILGKEKTLLRLKEAEKLLQ